MARSLIILLAVLIASCGGRGLDLAVSKDGDQLYFEVTNGRMQSINYTSTVFSGQLDLEQDLILAFERSGHLYLQCVRLEQVPMGRRTLHPGETLTFSISASQMSSLYCLEPGDDYQLHVLLLQRDGASYRIADISNGQPIIAVTGWRGDRSTSLSISSDGTRVELGLPNDR